MKLRTSFSNDKFRVFKVLQKQKSLYYTIFVVIRFYHPYGGDSDFLLFLTSEDFEFLK